MSSFSISLSGEPSQRRKLEIDCPYQPLKTVETALHIFSFLDHRSLSSCASVCHEWKEWSDDNSLWKPLIDRTYQLFPMAFNGHAKTVFKILTLDFRNINHHQLVKKAYYFEVCRRINSTQIQDHLLITLEKQQEYEYRLIETTGMLKNISLLRSVYSVRKYISQVHLVLTQVHHPRKTYCLDFEGKLKNTIDNLQKIIFATSLSPYLFMSDGLKLDVKEIVSNSRVTKIKQPHMDECEITDHWIILNDNHEVAIYSLQTFECMGRFELKTNIHIILSDEKHVVIFYPEEEWQGQETTPSMKVLIWTKEQRMDLAAPFRGLVSAKKDVEWDSQAFILKGYLVIYVDKMVKTISLDDFMESLISGKYFGHYDQHLLLAVKNSSNTLEWKIWNLEAAAWDAALEMPPLKEYIPCTLLRAGPFLVLGTKGGYVYFFNRRGKRLASFQPYVASIEKIYHIKENLIVVPSKGDTVTLWPLPSLKLLSE